MSKKMKIITITSIAALCVVVIIGGLLIGLLYKKPIKSVKYEGFYSQWQDYLKDDVKIIDAVMPGAHDSGTKGMISIAETQSSTIEEQLKAGVRYFDLRVAKSGGKLVIFHSVIKGIEFSSVINSVKTFLNENPTQFLTLDFQHFEGGAEQETADELADKLNAKTVAVPNNVSLKNLTLGEIRKQKYNFVITWGSTTLNEDDNFIFPRTTSLKSPYDGKEHSKGNENLIKKFDEYYLDNTKDTLFVLQSQLTPSGLDSQFALEKQFCEDANTFLKNLPNNKELLGKTNIVMRDFITMNKDTINLIIGLNLHKNNIINEKKEQFSECIKLAI